MKDSLFADEDEKIFLAHVKDMTVLCGKRYSPVFSGFLDERRIMLAKALLEEEHFDTFRFFGGYENAIRRILCVYPEYREPSDEDFPLTALSFSFREKDSVTHSRLLGTLMSLGIKRELTGDIVAEQNNVCAVLSPAAAELAESITKVGRTGVTVSRIAPSSIVRQDSFKEITASVSSMRLDCVAAAAICLSRDKTAALIRSEGVWVNCVRVYAPDRLLKEGDVFSVRGKGKFILFEQGGETRKGRTFITVKKYV